MAKSLKREVYVVTAEYSLASDYPVLKEDLKADLKALGCKKIRVVKKDG